MRGAYLIFLHLLLQCITQCTHHESASILVLSSSLAIVYMLFSFLAHFLTMEYCGGARSGLHLHVVLAMALKPSPLAPQAASMQIDLHIALPEASAVMGSVVLVVRRSNGVDGSIDVIDQIDGFVWCLYGILMGRMRL